MIAKVFIYMNNSPIPLSLPLVGRDGAFISLINILSSTFFICSLIINKSNILFLSEDFKFLKSSLVPPLWGG